MARNDIPSEDGWYWMWDEELTTDDKWCMAKVSGDTMYVAEPDYGGDMRIWAFAFDSSTGEWSSVGDRYTETNPTRWVKIEVPHDPS